MCSSNDNDNGNDDDDDGDGDAKANNSHNQITSNFKCTHFANTYEFSEGTHEI